MAYKQDKIEVTKLSLNKMIEHKRIIVLALGLCLLGAEISAKSDSLTFTNGEMIVGEIKTMNRGVLVMETEYSDSDFEIEFKRIARIKSETHFLILLEDGSKYHSTVSSLNDSIAVVSADTGQIVSCRLQSIAYLDAFDDKFLDRLSASIDLGFDLAKAQNLSTLSSRSSIQYKAEKWAVGAHYNVWHTTQDDTDPINRSDGALNYFYILKGPWYVIATTSVLTNTEQKLDMRFNAQLGFGNFLVRNNKLYWGVKLGANRNMENFSNETEDRDSWEAYLGSELNLYDLGDFSLTFLIMAYPGITERSRVRSDLKFDLKYDLPFNLFLKIGTSVNYDNLPAQEASKLDYVLHTGFGWEW